MNGTCLLCERLLITPRAKAKVIRDTPNMKRKSQRHVSISAEFPDDIKYVIRMLKIQSSTNKKEKPKSVEIPHKQYQMQYTSPFLIHKRISPIKNDNLDTDPTDSKFKKTRILKESRFRRDKLRLAVRDIKYC